MTKRKILICALLCMMIGMNCLMPAWAEGPGGGMGSFGGQGGFGGQGSYGSWPGSGMMPGGEGEYGFGGPGQQGQQVTETTLFAMPAARAVKSGETLTIDYDLVLVEMDSAVISTIEQGATLNYKLLYYSMEDDENYTEGGSGTAEFSMQRSNDERCTISVTPEAEQTCRMKVQASMTLRDGTVYESTSDMILVYTAAELRSHISTQACTSGDTVQVDFMLLGPEGPWSFTCYAARSYDGGNTYQRDAEPMLTFQVNSREVEPKKALQWTIRADDNCMVRIEATVTLPDGSTIEHLSDPVRVQPAVSAS